LAEEIKAHSSIESFAGLLLKSLGAANKAKNIDSGKTKDERRCTNT